MYRYILTCIFITGLILSVCFLPESGAADADYGENPMILRMMNTPFKGDLDEMIKNRRIRVLVTYSRTNFFIDNGAMRGFEYELMRQYEAYINKGKKNKSRMVKIFFIPLPFDELFEALEKGRGDIAAAGLTVTPGREKAGNRARSPG